jgi:hypothetical protein
MGVEEVVIAPRSPWQNPFVDRLIGSVRRECLHHVIVGARRLGYSCRSVASLGVIRIERRAVDNALRGTNREKPMIKRHGGFIDYWFTPMTDEQQTELATEVADRIGEPLMAIDADLQARGYSRAELDPIYDQAIVIGRHREKEKDAAARRNLY